MRQEHFWFVDDEQRVRWAVRVSPGYSAPGGRAEEARIVFTSRDLQLSTGYPLEKDEQELSGYEVRELLAQAKLEATVGRRTVAA